MINYYFPIDHIPPEEGGDIDSVKFRLIKIKDHCNKCEIQFSIGCEGSEVEETLLKDYCSCISTFEKLWKTRIVQPVIDVKNDGCKCDKCTEWVPMAISNMPNNKFRCYRCRANPY